MQFKKGDLVGLSTKNLRFKDASRKLAPRFVGPFRILERIGRQAYRIALPEQYNRLHNVFPIQLLEPWRVRAEEEEDTLPMPDLEDEDSEWEVEEIKAKEVFKGNTYFLVKWTGWLSEYNQWVPEEDMTNCQQLLDQFDKSRMNMGKSRSRAAHQAKGRVRFKD